MIVFSVYEHGDNKTSKQAEQVCRHIDVLRCDPAVQRIYYKHAHLKDIDLFKGILSSYVMRGQSKSAVWSDGVKSGVFLELMRRMTALFFSTNLD